MNHATSVIGVDSRRTLQWQTAEEEIIQRCVVREAIRQKKVSVGAAIGNKEEKFVFQETGLRWRSKTIACVTDESRSARVTRDDRVALTCNDRVTVLSSVLVADVRHTGRSFLHERRRSVDKDVVAHSSRIVQFGLVSDVIGELFC